MTLSTTNSSGVEIGLEWRGKRVSRSVARHPILSFLLPFLLVLLGRAFFLGQVPPPEPLIDDEFSYLLAGETFASFRVTNPPHPLWQHFETIDELMQPTYMSKYPPMQGLFLACGIVLFRTPWAGVLLVMALFCGLLPWVFRAWLPCGWALVGALLATYKIGLLSYWTDSYWGGGVAALGGALALGSARRLSLRSTPGMAAVFALGGGILGNSRPFEGFVLMVILSGYLLWAWFGNGRWRTTGPGHLRQFFPAASLVTLPILVAMGYYNYRVTGHVLDLPYQVYERQYAVWTPFVWQQSPSPQPVYRHEFIRSIWIDWDSSHKAFERSHWPLMHGLDFAFTMLFFFGPVFFVGGFLLIPALFFGTKSRTTLIMLILFYAAIRVMSELAPHYFAPATALFYLVATASLRTVGRFMLFNFPVGKWLRLIVLILFIAFTTSLRTEPLNRYLWFEPHMKNKREQVQSVLDAQPGQQLVFVHHGPLDDPNNIWIYNHADIDASRVVWVDCMTPKENQQVIDYYGHHRKAWLLDDHGDLILRSYENPTAQPLLIIRNPPSPSKPQ